MNEDNRFYFLEREMKRIATLALLLSLSQNFSALADDFDPQEFAQIVENYLNQKLDKALNPSSPREKTINSNFILISCASLTPSSRIDACAVTCENERCNPKNPSQCLTESIAINNSVAKRAGEIYKKVFEDKFKSRLAQKNVIAKNVFLVAHTCLLLNSFKETKDSKCVSPTNLDQSNSERFSWKVLVDSSKTVEEYQDNLHKMMNSGNSLTQDYLTKTQVIDLAQISDEASPEDYLKPGRNMFYYAQYDGQMVLAKSQCETYSEPATTRIEATGNYKKVDPQGRNSIAKPKD